MKKDAFIENLELDVIMLRKNAAALEDVKEVPISGKFMASIMKELAGLKEQKIPAEPVLSRERDFWECPKCGTEVEKHEHHCRCGQTLVWKE